MEDSLHCDCKYLKVWGTDQKVIHWWSSSLLNSFVMQGLTKLKLQKSVKSWGFVQVGSCKNVRANPNPKNKAQSFTWTLYLNMIVIHIPFHRSRMNSWKCVFIVHKMSLVLVYVVIECVILNMRNRDWQVHKTKLNYIEFNWRWVHRCV